MNARYAFLMVSIALGLLFGPVDNSSAVDPAVRSLPSLLEPPQALLADTNGHLYAQADGRQPPVVNESGKSTTRARSGTARLGSRLIRAARCSTRWAAAARVGRWAMGLDRERQDLCQPAEISIQS